MEKKTKEPRLSPDSIQNASAAPNETDGLTAQNRSEIARNTCTPIGIPPEVKRSQNANKSLVAPILDESKLWASYADLIASLPEADRTAVKLGILEEYILAGIRQGKPITTLFLLATLGISIANNDRPFYEEVQRAYSK